MPFIRRIVRYFKDPYHSKFLFSPGFFSLGSALHKKNLHAPRSPLTSDPFQSGIPFASGSPSLRKNSLKLGPCLYITYFRTPYLASSPVHSIPSSLPLYVSLSCRLHSNFSSQIHELLGSRGPLHSKAPLYCKYTSVLYPISSRCLAGSSQIIDTSPPSSYTLPDSYWYLFLQYCTYRVCPIGTDRRIFVTIFICLRIRLAHHILSPRCIQPFQSIHNVPLILDKRLDNQSSGGCRHLSASHHPPPPPSLWSSIAAPWRGPVQANYNYWSTCSMRHATSPLPLLMIYQ